ncbi:MAG TPA: GNAT family N-acetyltransferase [Candidatus Binatia bacterium]|nr:GNAT family N-acetyltransferase [Candidatus Binatia bacterium]
MFNYEVRHYCDEKALRAVALELRSARLLSSAIPGLDPEYLAEGFEGALSGAIVACRDKTPFAYMTYAMSWKRFRAAIGPLSFGWLPFRQLRIFGIVGSPPNHLVDEFLRLLLARKEWDVAEMFELAPDHALAGRLASLPMRRGCRIMRKDVPTIQVKLEDNFEAYLQNRLHKKARYNLKREVRLLDEAAPGEVEVKVFRSAEEVAPFLRDAEAIARLTYQWKMGMTTVQMTPRALQRVSCLARAGQWRSYILYIRGVPAAYCYATIRHGELNYETIGYDPQFAKLNPGKVLLFKILQDLHESRAVAALDLGRGITDYKLLFANAQRHLIDISLFPNSAYSQFLWMLATATDEGYRRLRPALRHWMPWVKRKIQKTLGLVLPGIVEEQELLLNLIALD